MPHQQPAVCHAREENPDCNREHRCYLYVGHYGRHKAKFCYHHFGDEPVDVGGEA